MSQDQSILEKYRKMKKRKRLFKFLFSGGLSLTGLFIFLGFFLFILLIVGGSSESDLNLDGEATGNINLSPEVLALQSLVEKEAREQGIPDKVPYILAIMQVESGGKLPDPMQSSESAGLPVNSLVDAASSIKQGVKHFKATLDLVNSLGSDIWTAVQAYNFGSAYVLHVSTRGKVTTTKIADEYSRTVVAPSLGNTTGLMYNYPNPVAIPYNGGKLYWNGGNFFYDLLVKQYVQLGGAGTSNGNNSAKGWKKKAIENARSEIGQVFPTGWDMPGECIKAVQRWINSAGGTFGVGGVRSGYLSSGAKEVPWQQVQSGDVIQYENIGDPELFASGVHTMLVESVNSDGTVNVVECNNPGGSGLVGERSNVTNNSPAGWRTVVWRFP